MKCWEERGCKGLTEDCPHFTAHNCPRTCMYTICSNPWHETVNAMEIFNHPEIDYSAALKENCHNCKFFLEHGPHLAGM